MNDSQSDNIYNDERNNNPASDHGHLRTAAALEIRGSRRPAAPEMGERKGGLIERSRSTLLAMSLCIKRYAGGNLDEHVWQFIQQVQLVWRDGSLFVLCKRTELVTQPSCCSLALWYFAVCYLWDDDRPVPEFGISHNSSFHVQGAPFARKTTNGGLRHVK
uniref:Uncharacterized protein n=1 Tax=Ascaris lumbricoides TaxID=6252 RepID=A0A0M3I6B8_ASCLU